MDQRVRAAQAFDRGVLLFSRAEYREAAGAFLLADTIEPNATALNNAMAAAHKAGDHLAAVRAAQRAIARGADLAVQGRKVLAEASTHLSQIDLGCEPQPCSLSVDEEAWAAGQSYLLPGTHAFAADTPAGARARERITLHAGATYRVVLHPVAPGHALQRATVRQQQAPAPEHEATGLSPSVFYAGLGLTVVLAGVTTWSGLDTLRARRDLPDDPSQHQIDQVRSRMRRTDYLLAGTLVSAAASAWVGIGLVDWGTGRAVRAAMIPGPAGATLVATGHF